MQNKTYIGIDICKLICAILIVYMHCYCYEPGWSWIKSCLSSIGVPFFFIASGFFYAKGLRKTETPKSYLTKYLSRIVIMYLAWTILTLPVAWYNISIAHADYNTLLKVVYLLRCLFLTGSIGIYWYLLALFYNSIIIYYSFTHNKQSLLFIVSVIFFSIGILYDGGYLIDSFLGNFIHIVIGSERNFLNVGLFYMCIGYYISSHEIKNHIVYIPLLILSIIVSELLLPYTNLHFMHAFSAFIFFLIALNLKISLKDTTSLTIRKMSTAIYLGHFPFILVFDYYLKRGTLIDVCAALTFSILLWGIISFLFPDKYTKYLYG